MVIRYRGIGVGDDERPPCLGAVWLQKGGFMVQMRDGDVSAMNKALHDVGGPSNTINKSVSKVIIAWDT